MTRNFQIHIIKYIKLTAQTFLYFSLFCTYAKQNNSKTNGSDELKRY